MCNLLYSVVLKENRHCIFQFAIAGFWSLYNFVLRARNPSAGICLLLLVSLENMPFHLLVVGMSMVMTFPSQELCNSSHLMQTIPCLLVLTYFILLFCSSASLT